jgi:high affinity Mn2+ porin
MLKFSSIYFFALMACLQSGVQAQDTSNAEPERWNAHFQSTFIRQDKPAFNSPYSGQNSMTSAKAQGYSLTATAFLGLRWGGNASDSTEFYFNPEGAQGIPFSNLAGLGGLTNSEQQKGSGDVMSIYRARAFVRQTWGQGGEREAVASSANQLAGSRDTSRTVLTVGNIAVGDIFDQNSYAHDARTQFTNWAFLTHGAYDFASDARGYTWGAALELIRPDWAIRAGRFIEPRQSNNLPLNWNIFKSYGDQVEYERSYALGEQTGKWRALLFRNVAVMGNYSDALTLANSSSTTPVLDTTRRNQTKLGMGLSVEQTLTKSTGFFVRMATHDGKSENYSFMQADRSVSAGLVTSGQSWNRADDKLGMALALHGLSSTHRAYLAAGGSDFTLGDGRLNYKSETIFESYYMLKLAKQQFTVSGQLIKNPAYNADRGPVRVLGVRWHTEF